MPLPYKYKDDHEEEIDEDCEHEQTWAEAAATSRAWVIRMAGCTVATTPLMIILLTFIDCFSRHVPWVPDDRILLATIAALGTIIAFAYSTKK